MAETSMAKDMVDTERATTPDEVLAALAADPGRDGFQQELDENHVVSFVARGPKLLVTFESLEDTLGQSNDGLPIGLDFVDDKGWSLLHFAARSDTWFRSGAVYDFLDELVDDCFFENFDQVMFYGAGPGGYAACAFSVAAPGATVLAIAPQATLDTERAGWDMRFPEAKRLRFDDRYGYAPDMLEGADRAFILFDPYLPFDHVHVSLFQAPNVIRLRCRNFTGLIELALREMDLLHRLIEAAASGTLTATEFFRLLRARRDHARYLRTLLAQVNLRNKPLRSALLCDYVLKKKDGGRYFRKSMAAIRDKLAAHGGVPEWLDEG